MIVGTFVLLPWLWLLNKADKEKYLQLIITQIKLYSVEEEKLIEDYQLLTESTDNKTSFKSWYLKQKIKSKQDELSKLKKGETGIMSLPYIVGMELLSLLNIDGSNKWYKEHLELIKELDGVEDLENKTIYNLSFAIGFSTIAFASLMILCAILCSQNNYDSMKVVLLVGIILVGLLVYASYDDLKDKVNKRRHTIKRDFAPMVSKLAILISSGMELLPAWYLTAYSQDTVLYKEMQRVYEEMNNNISPQQAYYEFAQRCKIKETSKLGSIISQNIEKGNSELSYQLITLSQEVWQEHKHYAKLKAEEAKSKLLIPIFMMFVGILVMVLAPTLLNM